MNNNENINMSQNKLYSIIDMEQIILCFLSVFLLLHEMYSTQERLPCTLAGVCTQWTGLFHLDIS